MTTLKGMSRSFKGHYDSNLAEAMKSNKYKRSLFLKRPQEPRITGIERQYSIMSSGNFLLVIGCYSLNFVNTGVETKIPF